MIHITLHDIETFVCGRLNGGEWTCSMKELRRWNDAAHKHFGATLDIEAEDVEMCEYFIELHNHGVRRSMSFNRDENGKVTSVTFNHVKEYERLKPTTETETLKKIMEYGKTSLYPWLEG